MSEQPPGGRRQGPPRNGSRGPQSDRGQRQGGRRGAADGPRVAPRSRPSHADPARAAAFEVLRAVEERDAYANLALPATLRERRLAGRDAAFATELVYGALRGRGLYDPILEAAAGRPMERLDPPLRDVLRLGAHQVLAMRVPPHAAVSATVGLAREVLTSGPAGLVNGVLRRLTERTLEEWVAEVAPPAEADALRHLAVVESHPAWEIRAFAEALRADGRDGDVTAGGGLQALLAADNAPPKVTLVARPGLVDVSQLVTEEGESPTVVAGNWSPYAAVLEGGDPHRLPLVREGHVGVQDEGSQLVALTLAAAPLEGSDARWADLCAGPGGKAALLAGLAAQRGASLLAVEVAEHRSELVRRALSPVPGDWTVETGDGREVGEAVREGRLEPFDRVIVDVPCTGLGALRRRPEARWRRQPSDVGSLSRLQRELLQSALDAVRPGGVVLYATCSPHLAETRLVVDDVLRRRSDVTRLATDSVVRQVALPGPDGEPIPLGPGPSAQLWPHVHGTDAMFMALLQRT